VIRAAIDIGTVATRLLVGDFGEGNYRRMTRQMTVTHLGEGMADGLLTPAAVARTLEAARQYADHARQLGAREVRLFATAALRQATNRPEVLAQARAMGLDITLLSPEQEATASFAGASMGATGPLCVMDVGGGSTEIAIGCDGQLTYTKSIPIGASRALALCPCDCPATPEQLTALRACITGHLAPLRGVLPTGTPLRAVAGAAYTLAALAYQQAEYDGPAIDGAPLSRALALRWGGALGGMDMAARRACTGMHPDRAPMVFAGMLCMAEGLAALGVDEFCYCDTDNTEGVLLLNREEAP